MVDTDSADRRSNTTNESDMGYEQLTIDQRSLYEQLCCKYVLEQGFKSVKKNKGAPGIDKESIETFESRLDTELSKLSSELKSWTYKPMPVRRVEIPKPGKNAGVRLLGVPCTRDRVVQATLKILLEPILDPTFSDHSYGFRPGRSQRQAVEYIQKIVQSGKEFVVDTDLSKFFDRVNHDRLINRLRKDISDNRILRIIGIILRSGVLVDGHVEVTLEGTVQGSPLSPLLSNVVLDELDKELENRGLEFCRFADDCQIFVKSQKSAERVMVSICKFIENKLMLVVNREKSKVAHSRDVKFLGMTIIEGRIVISGKSMNRAMEKIKELTPRGTHQKLEKAIEEINKWYVGWSSYHSMTQYPAQFKKLEAHIRRRLRSRLVSQQKRRRYLFNKLVKRGASKKLAAEVYSNKGRWALSILTAAHRAYTNNWFNDQMGLKIRSSEEHSHWLSLDQYVKVT